MCGPHIAIAPTTPATGRPSDSQATTSHSPCKRFTSAELACSLRGGSGICGVVRNLLPKFEQKGGDLLVHSAAVVHEEDLARPGGDQGAFSANVVP